MKAKPLTSYRALPWRGKINVMVLHVCRDTKIRLAICCGMLELCALNGIRLNVL